MKKVPILLIFVGVSTLGLAGCGQKAAAPTDHVQKAAFKADLSKMTEADRAQMAAAMHPPAPNAKK